MCIRDRHWLPIRFRVDFKVLTLTFKALNGLGPRYLAEHLLPPRSTRVTRASQEVRLRSLTPREARKEKTRNWAFSAVAPRLWNNLPPEIRVAPSLGIFKNQLKTWMFRQAFPPDKSWCPPLFPFFHLLLFCANVFMFSICIILFYIYLLSILCC